MKIRRILFAMFALSWMVVIFTMSARDADTSTEDSHFIGMTIGEITYSDFENWPTEEQQEFAQKIDFPVRKAAHATEYAILAIFVTGAMLPEEILERKKRKWYFLALWGFCVLYAISDEVHQYFVPGRACRLMDVGIDASGAFLGIGISWMIWKRLRK